MTFALVISSALRAGLFMALVSSEVFMALVSSAVFSRVVPELSESSEIQSSEVFMAMVFSEVSRAFLAATFTEEACPSWLRDGF